MIVDRMIDPFHELRLEAEYSKQLKRLITEYDALLAVKDYVQSRRDGMPEGGAYVMIPVAELDKALTALPKNLQGKKAA